MLLPIVANRHRRETHPVAKPTPSRTPPVTIPHRHRNPEGKSMRSIRRTFVALAMMLGMSAAALAAPAVATAATPSVPPVATSVDLVRAGGFTGVPVKWHVSDADPQSDEVRRLLDAVATPEFLALQPVYGPKNPCCDFFTYTLRVTYVGGRVKTVFTSELAEDEPALLTAVIHLTQKVGTTDGVS
jgi:hypothetical protein